jgi:hypothetical protein
MSNSRIFIHKGDLLQFKQPEMILNETKTILEYFKTIFLSQRMLCVTENTNHNLFSSDLIRDIFVLIRSKIKLISLFLSNEGFAFPPFVSIA